MPLTHRNSAPHTCMHMPHDLHAFALRKDIKSQKPECVHAQTPRLRLPRAHSAPAPPRHTLFRTHLLAGARKGVLESRSRPHRTS